MAREQLGICAEANLHGSYILCRALDGQEAKLRHILARIPQILNRLAEHFSEAMLSGFVAVSNHYWDSLYPWQRPNGLTTFPELLSEHVSISSTAADLLIQVRSDRVDVNYIAFQQIYQLLQAHIESVEHLHSFRYLDGRQLTGFTDMPANPRGMLRRKTALVDVSVDPVFAGGSYLHFYRLHLDLKRWQQLSLAQQEEVMGYRKLDGAPLAAFEYSPGELPAQSTSSTPNHVLLQQNMPFATLQTQGSLQLSFSAVNDSFRNLWCERLGCGASADYDHLLDYCQIDLAAAFFVPSLSYMEAAAQGHFSKQK